MNDFSDRFDLVSLRLGGAVLATNDDFFAEKENLLKPGPAVWKEHEYTDRGKWMDGWESRRKRTPGHDWAILRLGVPGIVRGAVVDTSFFRGNYPDACSIEACAEPIDASLERLLDPNATWVEVLGRSKLAGDSRNTFPIDCPWAFTHVRLNIFPDGGVARLRLYGDVAVAAARRLGLRVEDDLRNEKINLKVREHSLAKVPVLLVVGRKEAAERTVSIRRLGREGQQVLPLDAALAALADEAVPPDVRRMKQAA